MTRSNIRIIYALVISVFIQQSFADLNKCKYGDSDCILNFINTLAKDFSKGNPDYHLPSLDPLHIDEMTVNQGSAVVNMKIKVLNSEVYGLKDAHVLKVSGFTKNVEGKHEFQFKQPKLVLIGDYEMSGHMLLLPVEGKGKCNITIDEPVTTIRFKGEKNEKDGKTYMKVTDYYYNYEMKKGQTYFDNLFNGNTLLADTTNQFMNENWKELFHELKPSIRKSFGKLYHNLLDSVFNNHPYEELFEN